MNRVGIRPLGPSFLVTLGLGCAAIAAASGGCGDDSGTSSTSTSTGSGGSGGGAGATTATTTTGAGGSGGTTCPTTAPASTRGSAIAVSPNDSTVVVANRDVGTVTIMRVDYGDGKPSLTKIAEVAVGADTTSEPYQVAIDGCGERAFVTLRKDQKVVEIVDIDKASPKVGRTVSVGSEPTGIALSPNNTKLYAANWVEGTVSVIDTKDFSVTSTIDLNATLVGTGLLGTVTARPSLAHPRGIAITNNHDGKDDDETIYVSEWFGQRTAAEDATGSNADTNKEGILYKIKAIDGAASTIALPPVADVGINDHNNAVTGCYPNQVGSVTIDGDFVYVTSTCASPKGPLGAFQKAGACLQNTDCAALGGVCDLTVVPSVCKPNAQDVRTTTHPAVSIVTIASDTATTETLDKLFNALAGTKRMPLLPQDVDFKPGFAYVASLGTDALVRLKIDNGVISAVGSSSNNFITMRKDATDLVLRTPIGVATTHGTQAFGFVANEGSRDVTAVNFATQAIAGDGVADFRIASSSALPPAGSKEEKILRGKRFFETGLGRWSLGGEGWGACAACHVDGLTDDVTWYFNRGPRQSVSLDGTFASSDPTDQRILNWTAIFDEIPDFEVNTRNVSGGLGALVNPADTRINTATQVPPQQGLQGSSEDIADPMGASAHPHTTLGDWQDLTAYIRSIRSPRRPVGLVAADVAAGKAIFADSAQGNCVGCHSGLKWTISKRFYTPNDTNNPASGSGTGLEGITWNAALNGFPSNLFPVAAANIGSAKMRFGAAPAAEQIQCMLRPVGTFAISPSDVGVLEVRQDMKTLGQGSGASAADPGRGFNIPSLLGVQVGAPYYHAGNARTLEEAFDVMFVGHYQSPVAQIFNPDDAQKRQLIAYILSLDEDEAPIAIPALGATGGDLCHL